MIDLNDIEEQIVKLVKDLETKQINIKREDEYFQMYVFSSNDHIKQVQDSASGLNTLD